MLFHIAMYPVIMSFILCLYIAVKSGRATFKGFRRIEALQRLNAYKDGILKGYLGEDAQNLFEEL